MSIPPVVAAGVVNAYWGRDRLTLVERAPGGGIAQRTVGAEHSCFVQVVDLSPDRWDRLRRSPSVVQILEEGDWRRLLFVDRDACQAFCRAAHADGVLTYEGAISPVTRYMADAAPKVARPRICYLDLETDPRVPFSKKELARTLCWSVVSEDRATVQSGMLQADTDRRERELYAELWDVLDAYDLVAAWNGDRFDFEVVKARSDLHRLLGGRLDSRRWLWLDHLELFRRMNMSSAESGDEKQSMALEAVAQSVLGEGKLPFDARRAWEYWAAGGAKRRELLAYNRHDADLMPRIEAKTGYVELLLTVAESCGTFPDSRGVNPSVQVEGFLQRLAGTRGHKFPTVLKKGWDSGDKFKGAWVMEPKCSGIERDVHVCDFSRLYPSIIMSWNMSPETVARRTGGRMPGHSWSPLTDVSFRTDVEGVLPAAVAELLRLRAHWGALDDSLTPGTPEQLDAHRRSAAYKIAGNSFYGVVGQASSRFFERAVAESVAQCGVWLIGKTVEAAEARGMRVVYGDTDSLLVTGVTRVAFEDFVAWCNADLYPRLLDEVGARANKIKLAYDKQFDRFIIVSKKRYIASFVHSKGTAATADSKPEIKGLEYKRGDSLQMARRLQEQVVNMLVGYKCRPCDRPGDFAEVLDGWQERVLTHRLDLEDVLVSKRLAKPLNEYALRPLKDGSGYARQLPHIELARVLEARGMDVGEGAKIDYVVVAPREKPQRVVAADDWDGELDRAGLWQAYVYPPTQRLLEAAFPGWNWDAWLTEPGAHYDHDTAGP